MTVTDRRVDKLRFLAELLDDVVESLNELLEMGHRIRASRAKDVTPRAGIAGPDRPRRRS